jgi:hypothetical protein
MNTSAFFRFISSDAGRLVRIAAGLALIGARLGRVRGIGGWIMSIIGLVPLAAGTLDWCVLGPLSGLPFEGPRLRLAIESEPHA